MIVQEFSAPYALEQNGKVERSNRVVLEMVRTMVRSSRMSTRFWSDAVLAAAFTRNRCPTKVLGGKTLFEAHTGSKPDLNKLHVFGCRTQVLVPSHL